MKKLVVSAIFIMACTIWSSAQEPLFDVIVKDYGDKKNNSWGPGLKNYIHFYSGISVILGNTNDNVSIKIPNSMCLDFGWRYKRKVFSFWDLGLDISFDYRSYSLKQNAAKTFPDSIIYNKKQIFDTWQLNGGAFTRFNLGRHGNKIRKFLDIGYGISLNLDERVSNIEKYGKLKTQTYMRGYDFLDDISFNAFSRLGFGQFALTASYRISEAFKTSYNFGDLPRLTAGIEIALF